jgi:hypothetical protein
MDVVAHAFPRTLHGPYPIFQPLLLVSPFMVQGRGRAGTPVARVAQCPRPAPRPDPSATPSVWWAA